MKASRLRNVWIELGMSCVVSRGRDDGVIEKFIKIKIKIQDKRSKGSK